MKESEARTKWCPFARAFDGDSHGASAVNRNSEGGIHPENRCLASNCMAWQWATSKKENGWCGLTNP